MDENSEETVVFPPVPGAEPPAGSPPPSSRTPWIIVAVLSAVSLVLAGLTLWAFNREDPQVADLKDQVETLSGQLADAQAALDKASSDAGSAADDVASLQAQVDDLTKRLKKANKSLKASVPDSKLPVVIFDPPGLADTALRQEFQTKLVDPMLSWQAQVDYPTMLTVIVEIPQNDGDPYGYRTVFEDGQYEAALFGTKGDPLPVWIPPCEPGSCEGLD